MSKRTPTATLHDTFRIGRAIARGATSVVYRAWPAGCVDRRAPIALKVSRSGDPAAARALVREATLLSELDHPGIVRFEDSGTIEDRAWVALQRLSGTRLDRWIARLHGPGGGDRVLTKAALTRVGDLLVRLCLTLDHLHERGIVHGDLKPENIVVTAGDTPVLLDFGIATTTSQDVRDTLEGFRRPRGSPGYAAPEVLGGETGDTRADLYAVGVILHELVFGQRPFDGPDAAAIVRAQRAGSLPDLAPPGTGIPRALAHLIATLLQPSPRNRAGYATDVARALIEMGIAGPVSLPERTWLHRPAIHGRNGPLRRLAGVLDEAGRGGAPRAILVGDAGSGKTRLACACIEDAGRRGFAIVAASATEPPAGASVPQPPWATLRRLLLPLRALLDRMPPGHRDHALRSGTGVLESIFPDFGTHGMTRPPGNETRAFALPAGAARELRNVLAAVASRRPLLLVLDDLQWIDSPSLASVVALLREPEPIPSVAVLLAMRSGDAPEALAPLLRESSWHSLRLPPLGDSAMRALLSDLLGQEELPVGLRSRLNALQTGQPFLAAAMTQHLISRRELRRDGTGRWQFQPAPDPAGASAEGPHSPPTIGAAIAAVASERLRGLAPEHRTLVEAAAVMEGPVTAQTLAELTDREPAAVREAMHPIAGAGWLVPVGADLGTWRFAHGYWRDAVRTVCDPAVLHKHHQRAAERSGRLGDALGQASHLAAIGRMEDSAEAMATAADQAIAAGAPDEAAAAWEGAIQRTTLPGKRARWAIRAAVDALIPSERLTHARTVLEGGRQEAVRAGDRLLELEAQLHSCLVRTRLGASLAVLAELAQPPLVLLRDGDDRLAALWRLVLGRALIRAERCDEAIGPLREAISLFSRDGDGPGEGQARVGLVLAQRYTMRQPEQCAALVATAMALHTSHCPRATATVFRNLVPALVAAGHVDSAERLARMIARLEKAHGLTTDSVQAGLFLGQILHAQGNHRAASAHYRRCVRFAADRGNPMLAAFAEGLLAVLERGRGRYGVAIRLGTRAIEWFRNRGLRDGDAHLGATVAAALLAQGRLADAERTAEQSVEIARDMGVLPAQSDALTTVARLHRLSGRYAQAAATLDHALSVAVMTECRLNVTAEAIHLALARGDNPSLLRDRLQQLQAEATAIPFSELPQVLRRVERALALGRSGESRMLYRGEPLDAIPHGLRRVLVRRRGR